MVGMAMSLPLYEEEYDGLVIMEYTEFKLSKPSFLILGLPDVGLVGAIGVNHVIDVLGMEEVAGIDVVGMTLPIAVISSGKIRPPVRIYAKDNLMALTVETPLPSRAVYTLSRVIIDYAMKRGVDYIVSIAGIASPNRMNVDKPKVYWIASSDKARELVNGLDVEEFTNGYLVGPYALVLKRAIRSRLPNLVLLAEAYMEFPDPEASAALLGVLSKIIGREVDVKKLLEQAELIRLKLRSLMKQTRQTMSESGMPSPLIYS